MIRLQVRAVHLKRSPDLHLAGLQRPRFENRRSGYGCATGDPRGAASPGPASAPGRGLHPRGHRNRSHTCERSRQAVAVAPMGWGARVGRGRSLVRTRACRDAGRAGNRSSTSSSEADSLPPLPDHVERA
jgi:hypothetical protein